MNADGPRRPQPMLRAQSYKLFTSVLLTYALLNSYADAQTEDVPETTTPATTTSDPTQTSGIWNVDGDCRIVAEDPACITSMNYPSAYGNQEFCSMEWPRGGAYRVLLVESFETEEGADFFTVNGIVYSGAGDGLNGVGAYGQITWTSDESTTASGWKICARELASEVGSEDESWIIVDGDCEIDADEPECITSPNFPKNYDNSNDCKIVLAGSSPRYLEVTDFETQPSWDYVSIDSILSVDRFSGNIPGSLHGFYMPTSSFVAWTSDSSTTYGGWRICARTTSDFGEYVVPTKSGGSGVSSSSDEDDTADKLVQIGLPILGGVILFMLLGCGLLWKRKQMSQQKTQTQDLPGEVDVEQAPATTTSPPTGSVVDSVPSPPLAAPVQASDGIEAQSNHPPNSPEEASK